MMQQMAATGNNPKRSHAAMMPANRVITPVVSDKVVRTMSGKVITASVTKGT